MTTNDFIQECKDSGKFNWDQIDEIIFGFLYDNLTIEQIKVFAQLEYKWEQMEQIRKGFENHLTIEQVKVYANPEFSWQQMWEIRKGFKNGLTIKQIKLFAHSKFNDEQMEQIRKFIEENNDMSINTIKFLIGINCI